MTINEATLRQTKLYPELIPDTWVGNITASEEVSPALLDLRRFPNLILELANIGVSRDDQVEARLRADTLTLSVVAGSLLQLAPNRFNITAKGVLWLTLWASAGKSNYREHHGVWIYQPTVAHKLKLGVPLTAEEREIAREFNIAETVAKGNIPLPIPYLIEREYQILSEETHGKLLTLSTTEQMVEAVVPLGPEEFLVLTRLACDPGTAAENVRISLDRDEDANYLSELKTYPLSLDWDLFCFIPALSELRLRVIAASTVADWNVRYTLLRCRMTDTLRCRWGLLTKEEAPGDVWAKVRGGIL